MKNRLKNFLNELQLIDAFIGFIGVLCILAAALVVQIFFDEEPCPLCLLQRTSFIAVGISFLMTLRYGNSAKNWGSAILSASVGIAVSIRQICLHITTPEGFGRTFYGFHMYTWCFFAFSAIIIGSAFTLLIYPEKTN